MALLRLKCRLAISISLLLLLPGCVTPKRVAKKLVEAPGTKYEKFIYAGFDLKQFYGPFKNEETGKFNQGPFIRKRIELSDSGIELDIAILNPVVNNLKMDSEYTIEDEVSPDEGAESSEKTFVHTFSQSLEFNWDLNKPQEPTGTIFMLHGYGATKETLLPWAVFLSSNGYQTILVDVRGHGRSGGKRVFYGVRESWDMKELLDTISTRLTFHENVGVLGYSYGCGIAIKWAAIDPRIKTIFALAPYGAPKDSVHEVIRLFGLDIDSSIIDRAIEIADEKKLIDWKRSEVFADLEKIDIPILFARGEHDTVSTADTIERLFESAPDSSQALEIKHANHSDIAFFFRELKEPMLTWFNRNLPGEPIGGQEDEFTAVTVGALPAR